MTTTPVTVPVEILRELIDSSSEVRDLLAKTPEMQGREYNGTGIRFVNAIGAAQRAYVSAAPAPEGGAVKGPWSWLTAYVEGDGDPADREYNCDDMVAAWRAGYTALATREEAPAEAGEQWHLGSMNDGLFIINALPRPSGTDFPPGISDNGPTMVMNVTELPDHKAKAIVDAHNAALRAQPQAREDAQPVGWTEDMERERREADYERGFRHGKKSAFDDARPTRWGLVDASGRMLALTYETAEEAASMGRRCPTTVLTPLALYTHPARDDALQAEQKGGA